MLTIFQALAQQLLIQLFHACGYRQGNQIIPQHKANQTFDPSLFVGLGRIAKTGLKIIVGVKSGKGFLFLVVFAPHDYMYCRRQVILDDGLKNAAKEAKGLDMTIKKGFLPFPG